MRRFASLLSLLMLLSFFAGAQDRSFPLPYHDGMEVTLEHADFNGNFSLLVATDNSYDYYATDLSKLESDFRKTYFLNLLYQEKRIISIDSDLKKDYLWVKASSIYTGEEVLCLLNEMKEETMTAANHMTAEEKQVWMQQHKKLTAK